jgi:hypothetical protein
MSDLNLYELTPDEIIENSKFFRGTPESNRGNRGIDCYVNNTGTGYDGCRIEIKYLRGRGYYWDVMQFGESNNSIAAKTDWTAKNIYVAFADANLKVCPRCGGKIYDGKLHDFEKCITMSERLGNFIYRNKEVGRVWFCRLKRKLGLMLGILLVVMLICSCGRRDCRFDIVAISRYRGWVVAQKDGAGWMSCDYSTACKEYITDEYSNQTLQIWTTKYDYDRYQVGEKIK